MFFPESNVWDEKTLEQHVHEHNSNANSKGEVEVVQTVSEKQEFMDVDAEIGLSFMGIAINMFFHQTKVDLNHLLPDGQVKVSGSAGFMKDKVETNKQVGFVSRLDVLLNPDSR